MATYKWLANTRLQGDSPLSRGVDPNTWENWQTASTGHQSPGTITYWYRDSNYGPGGVYSDANSSRVAISLTEEWDASVDDLNNLTISIVTTINSVVRDDLRGTNRDTPGRYINIYREQGGAAVLSLTDTQLASAHTIWAGPLVLSSHTLTLTPGQSAQKSSLYVHNQTIGESGYDDIWAGIQFMNDLPAPTTYRVQYNANGGTGAPGEQSHTTAQSSWTFNVASGSPTWGLYQFLGWSRTQYSDSRTEADVEFRAGDSITLQQSNSTVILYAVWRKNYRPGATYNNIWLGHERPGGTCHILSNPDNGIYTEMRTIGGDVNQMGTPPSVFHDNKWYNQHRRGKE